jgi:hypothetical protein
MAIAVTMALRRGSPARSASRRGMNRLPVQSAVRWLILRIDTQRDCAHLGGLDEKEGLLF